MCVAPQTASAQPAPLEVTFNGVDWIGNATHGEFTYTGSATPDLVAPSSGPRHGGTNFYLGILPRPPSHMLASAGLAACRLGNDTQPASFDQQRGGLRCATPLLTPPAAVGECPVYATINGQQFEPSPSATWRYVYSVQDLLSGNTASGGGGASPSPPSAPPSAPPPLGTPGSGAADLTQVGSGLAGSGTSPSSPSSPAALALRVGPLTGPTEGGTRLTLNASFALTIATELRCRFGHAAGGSGLATVAATSVYLAACVSPPLTPPGAIPGAIPLGLSLNGQQFFDFETFTSYAPAQPSAITPLGAAIDGGLEVGLVGTGLGGGLGHRTCHFGMAVVPATYEASAPGGEVLRCRVPSADAAGFRTSLTIRFDDPPRLSELGSLHGQAALRGGALRLVPRAVPSGTPYPYSGALLLRVLPGAPPLGTALPFWRVRFDMMMHGASSRALGGGGGISLNYGPPSATVRGSM